MHARVCLCARVCTRARLCARAHRASGACALGKTLLGCLNLESFPLSRSCCPDTPRVQQEAVTSVASLPDSPPAAAAVH